MRVVLAALFVYAVIVLSGFLLLDPLEEVLPSWAATLLLVLAAVILIIGTCLLFNQHEERWPDLSLEEMRQRGLVESQEFQARRALQVDETEDEGIHLFLELDDGLVLFLSGQYLYEYGADEDVDGHEPNQDCLFPNTRFIVHRHTRAFPDRMCSYSVA